jgi:hypothetical protein
MRPSQMVTPSYLPHARATALVGLTRRAVVALGRTRRLLHDIRVAPATLATLPHRH